MSDESLEALFRDCREDLQRYFRRRVDSADSIGDLIQETFLRLLRAGSVTTLREPRAYLFRTASNLVTDHYRSASCRPEAFIGEADWQALPDPMPSPETVVLSREELAELQRAIDDLPPRGREVLTLHKFQGLSYAEIGVRLGISQNTVVVHMVRSLAHCRARLETYRRGHRRSL